jgi:cell division protein FtsI/penicillin-binding protein 2
MKLLAPLVVAGLLSVLPGSSQVRPAASAASKSNLVGIQSGNDDALFRRTAAQVLAREFPAKDLSYLLFDIQTMSFIANRWEDSSTRIPIGSLVKPFTAMSYAETHAFRFPEFTCDPNACWYPRGHGRMDIVRAVGFSCNSYFIQLASQVSPASVQIVAHRFGLSGPETGASADAMAGRYGVWQESPENLVKAYSELLARRDQPGVREIVQGMALSAKEGTAVGIAKQRQKVSVLAKTGTAPCTHADHAPGDGFVLMAWPADSPKYILLVRQHSNPGAHAATIAGDMLAKLQR